MSVAHERARAIWLRAKSEVAWLRLVMAADRLIGLLEEAKFNPYHDELGRFTTGPGSVAAGGSESGVAPRDSSNDESRTALLQFAPAAEKAAEAALYLYLYLTARNSKDTTAALAFNAREFLPGAAKDDPAVDVRQLTREDVRIGCPRDPVVQQLTDKAADMVRREGYNLKPTEYGTRVHTILENSVNSLRDTNFRAEVSAIKSIEEGRRARGAIRGDVIGNVGDGNVCVYDIKTGKSGLSLARMREIANNVHSLYPGTNKILVIEKRPR